MEDCRATRQIRDGAEGIRVFAEPRATFGKIGLVMKR